MSPTLGRNHDERMHACVYLCPCGTGPTKEGTSSTQQRRNKVSARRTVRPAGPHKKAGFLDARSGVSRCKGTQQLVTRLEFDFRSLQIKGVFLNPVEDREGWYQQEACTEISGGVWRQGPWGEPFWHPEAPAVTLKHPPHPASPHPQTAEPWCS